MTPQDAQQPPENRSGDTLGTPGGVTGDQGLGEAIRAEANAWARRQSLLVLADRADALEREAARLGDLVDETETIARGYRADAGRLAGEVLRLNSQVERVRAHVVRMTNRRDEKTRRHGTALLDILDGDS